MLSHVGHHFPTDLKIFIYLDVNTLNRILILGMSQILEIARQEPLRISASTNVMLLLGKFFLYDPYDCRAGPFLSLK